MVEESGFYTHSTTRLLSNESNHATEHHCHRVEGDQWISLSRFPLVEKNLEVTYNTSLLGSVMTVLQSFNERQMRQQGSYYRTTDVSLNLSKSYRMRYKVLVESVISVKSCTQAPTALLGTQVLHPTTWTSSKLLHTPSRHAYPIFNTYSNYSTGHYPHP